MINLIIDAANDKIFFKIMADDKSYTSEFSNNRENFDKLTILVVKFLENHQINIKNLNTIAKALSLTNKIDLYEFRSDQVMDQNYNEIIDLFNKGLLNKNLIKPQY